MHDDAPTRPPASRGNDTRPDPVRPDGTRRDFLAAGALLAGAAGVLSGCRTAATPFATPTPGRRTPLAKGGTIKLGVIGVGGMGGEHTEQLSHTRARGQENVEVVAISDVCRSRLEGWTKRASEVQKIQVDGYLDPQALLARPDLHGVLIATPEHQHAPLSLAAIEAGKDVYCEKPMTLDLAEALQVERAVAASDLVFQVGSQFVMLPKYQAAAKLVREGAIGHPTLSQASYCRNSEKGEWLYDVDPKVVPGPELDWDRWLGHLGPQAWDPEVYFRWRRYRKFSGGVVADLLVHPATPLLGVIDAGWPVRVSASGGHYVHKDMENHDQVFVTVEFEREHTLVLAGSTCNELGMETIVRGHRGNLFLGGNDCVLRPERVYADDVDERKVACPSVEDQNALRLDWLSCIRTRGKTAAPPELGAQVMVIVDLAVRSLWDGHAWSFDPRTREVRRA